MSAYIKRRITTELPTTLEAGEEIYYQDANGNLTLWVGRADGTAWPACGFTTYSAKVKVTSAAVLTILSVKENTMGTVTIGSPFGTSSFQLILPSSYGNVGTGFCSVQGLALSAGASTRYFIYGAFSVTAFPANSPRATINIRDASLAEALPDTEIEFDVMIHFWPSVPA